MQKNLGRRDGLIRAILGIGAMVVFFKQLVNDYIVELIFGFVGLYLLITAIIEFCPVYYVFGIKTRQGRKRKFY